MGTSDRCSAVHGGAGGPRTSFRRPAARARSRAQGSDVSRWAFLAVLAVLCLNIAASAASAGGFGNAMPRSFNRLVIAYDNSGSRVGLLEQSWEEVEKLLARFRLQPTAELIIVAINNQPVVIFDGAAGDLARAKQAFMRLKRAAPGSGTDIMTGMSLAAHELNRTRTQPARKLLWVFSDMHVDQPRDASGMIVKVYSTPEEFDWSVLRGVEGRVFYIDPGRDKRGRETGKNLVWWERFLRSKGLNWELYTPVQVKGLVGHIQPPAVPRVHAGLTPTARKVMTYGACLVVAVVVLGIAGIVILASWSNRRRAALGTQGGGR